MAKSNLGYIHGFKTGALACVSITGYASPKIESIRLVHGAEIERLKSQNTGNTEGIIAQDEILECTFDVVPQGASVATALESISIPLVLATFSTSGFHVMEIGSWSDALNVTSGTPGGHVWVYEGGAAPGGQIGNKWTLTLPLRRYVAIASISAVDLTP